MESVPLFTTEPCMHVKMSHACIWHHAMGPREKEEEGGGDKGRQWAER